MKFKFNHLVKALVAGALCVALVTAQAATVVFTIPSGSAWNATNLFTGAARITAVTINTGAGAGATNLTYAFNDFPGFNAGNGWGPIMQTNTGYMAVGQYVTNILKIQTNFGGVYTNADGTTNWVTISNALWVYTNYVGATSNIWRLLAVGTVNSNSSSTLTLPSGGIPVIYGLGFTNNSIGVGATITITYNPSL